MSGLLDDIKQDNRAARPSRCPIDLILADLKPSDRADLEVAMSDASIMHVSIARALANRGYTIRLNGKSIAAHRKEQCGCARG